MAYIYIYHIKLAATAGHVPGVKEMPAYGRASPSMWCPLTLPCLVRAAYGQRNYIYSCARPRAAQLYRRSALRGRTWAAQVQTFAHAYGRRTKETFCSPIWQRRPRPSRSPTGGAGWRHHARLRAAQQHGARLRAARGNNIALAYGRRRRKVSVPTGTAVEDQSEAIRASWLGQACLLELIYTYIYIYRYIFIFIYLYYIFWIKNIYLQVPFHYFHICVLVQFCSHLYVYIYIYTIYVHT